MKKYSKFIAAVMALTMALTPVLSVSANEEIEYNSINVSWQFYDNRQELIENSDIIFTGTIKNISFQILDIKTGSVPTEKTAKRDMGLYTIYDVDVLTTYKGIETKSIQIKLIGGLKDYNIQEQLYALCDYGIIENYTEEDTVFIPIVDDKEIPSLKIGTSYLFLTVQFNENTLLLSQIPHSQFIILETPLLNIAEYLQKI